MHFLNSAFLAKALYTFTTFSCNAIVQAANGCESTFLGLRAVFFLSMNLNKQGLSSNFFGLWI